MIGTETMGTVPVPIWNTFKAVSSIPVSFSNAIALKGKRVEDLILFATDIFALRPSPYFVGMRTDTLVYLGVPYFPVGTGNTGVPIPDQ